MPSNTDGSRERVELIEGTSSQDGKASDCKSDNAGVRFSPRAPKIDAEQDGEDIVGYKLNGRNFSVVRLMGRGKNFEDRLKYLHASAKGTTVVTPTVVARVSLPGEKSTTGPIGTQPVTPVIWPQKQIDELTKPAPESGDFVEMPDGLPAVTGPDYLVPNLDKLIPEAGEQNASITVNGETLLKVLKVACEVTEDNDKTVRLRICPEKGLLRVDTYREPGKQEFVASIVEIEYYGGNIPGDKTKDTPEPVKEVKPSQATHTLKASTGRRFRG